MLVFGKIHLYKICVCKIFKAVFDDIHTQIFQTDFLRRLQSAKRNKNNTSQFQNFLSFESKLVPVVLQKNLKRGLKIHILPLQAVGKRTCSFFSIDFL